MLEFEIGSMNIPWARICLVLHEVYEGVEDCGSGREREGMKVYVLVHSFSHILEVLHVHSNDELRHDDD